MSLAGKVAIITGASSGIGAETAKLFAAQGCKVVCAARRVQNLEKVVAEIKAAGGEAMYVSCDVEDVAQIKNMFAKTMEAYGRLDIMFNNAGWEGPTMCPEPTGFPSLPDDVLIKINAINMTAPLLCAKYAIIEMQKNEPSGGVVIGNSSVGAIMPLEVANLLPQYCPTKMYMDGITRSIATTHAPFGIKAFNVNPAAIQTEMWEKIYDEMPAYGKDAIAAMGVNSKEDYAVMFNSQIAAPGADPIIMADSVAQVALHYADGSTVCDSGDCLAIAPGCTFHVKDLYPFIYTGFGKGVDLDAVRRDWTGAPYPGRPVREPAAASPAAAPAAAPAVAPTTTTTTTTTGGGATTTTTVTTTGA